VIEFMGLDRYKIGDRPMVAVRLDRDTHDFSHLIGEVVVIDGVKHKVMDVERYGHSPPWRKDEVVGLWAELAK
jgi:hypothetical protein